MFDRVKFARILSLIIETYHSQRELTEKSGLSRTMISYYLNQKYEKPPKPDTLKKIADASNGITTYDELMIVCGYMNEETVNEMSKKIMEMYNYIMDNSNIKKHDNNIIPLPDEPIRLPVVGKISAGLPILAIENIIDYAFAPQSLIKKGNTYFYLLVQGDSMNLKFNDGDYILVQQQDILDNDEIGVFLIEEDATVKKYKEENGIIILYPMSSNPKHEPQIYNPKKTKIKILGKVISYQGKI